MHTLKLFKHHFFISSYKDYLSHFAFIFFFLVIFLVLTPIDHLDFYTHNKQLLNFYATGYWRPNFLYYLLLALVSGFSKNIWVLGKVSALIMAIAIYAKWLLTDKLAQKAFYNNENTKNFKWVAFLMLFVFSLPASYNNWYFGQISPNQWHNSTTILLMPFALALYYHTFQYFFENKKNSRITVLWLSVINVLIKPSFIFCLVPVVLILGFFYSKNKFAWLGKQWVFVPALLILACQYLILYLPSYKSAAILSGEEGGVAFNFLHVWQHYSNHILLSLLLSLAFPLALMVFYRKEVFRERQFVFALLHCVIAVLIFACFTETGSRQFHCNFIWQAIVANYILYWVGIHLFLKNTLTAADLGKIHIVQVLKFYLTHKQYKAFLVFSLFLLQCAGGFYYLLRMLVKNGSYG